MSLHEGNLASRFPKIAFVLQKLNSAMKEELEIGIISAQTVPGDGDGGGLPVQPHHPGGNLLQPRAALRILH